MGNRLLTLRYPAVCAGCGTELEAGTTAEWSSEASEARCGSCSPDHGPHRVTLPDGAVSTMPPVTGGLPVSPAAQRILDRLEAQRDEAIRARQRIDARLARRPTFDPQRTWTPAVRARGEQLVGARLDALAEDGVVAFHHRRVPGSPGTVDHVAVGPAGIFVVSAKRHVGRITRRRHGSLLSRDHRLHLDGRDQSTLLDDVVRQVVDVRSVLSDELAHVPVTPVVCFVDAEFGLLARPFTVRGVTVTWPTAMEARVAATGELDAETVDALALHLAHWLLPA